MAVNGDEPNVRRDVLPPAAREITLYVEDSPARPGNEPQPGDSDFTLYFPLHDGTRLSLHVGPATFNHFIAMLAAYAVDEAEAQM